MNTKTIYKIIFNVLVLLSFYTSVAQDLKTNIQFQTGEQFLIDQFNEKDVIFIGEFHRIKEHAEFICNIIPKLHENGINILFSEFANFNDTKLIDSLITAKTFNDSLARRIQFNNSWYWGYKEYIDIYYSAWKTNQNLLPNEKPFRIIGIEIDHNSLVEGIDAEQVWAHIIDSCSFEKGIKALVYCGINHSFTNYNQPYLVNDTLKGFVTTRVGNLLYKKYPYKTITILMHGPWYGYSYTTSVLPCNGMIDSLVNSLPEGKREIGFATSDIFFDSYNLNFSLYSLGYKNATIKDLCQGYIIIKPICELNPVSIIPNFINDSNIDDCIKQSGMGNLTSKEFNDTIKSWLEEDTKYLIELQKKNCK